MNEDQELLVQEKDSLVARLQNMDVEMEILSNQKALLEEQIRNGIEECGRLRKETSKSQDKILELEKIISEKGLEFSELREIHAKQENEASAQTMALKVQVDSLQQELDSLQAEKHQLLLQLEAEKQESTQRMNEMETRGSKLSSQIANLRRLLEEKDESYKKLIQEYKQVEGWLQECRADLGVAEKKLEVMAEEFHINIISKDQMVSQLEETIEDLKRDLEIKRDEFNTMVDNVHTIEVKLRLSNQKLRVTEQLLTEKEESFREAEANYQEQRQGLEEKITTLTGIIAADNATYQKIVSDITKRVNGSLTGTETLTSKFRNGHLRNGHSIEKISDDIQLAKKWAVEIQNARELLANELAGLISQLENTKERELILIKKVRKREEDNESLAKLVNQLEKNMGILETTLKEKDGGLVDLGKEKREAIRQLCLLIDYHRSRCDDLRKMIMTMPIRGRRD